MARSGITSADYRTLAEFRYYLRRFLRVREAAAKAAGIEPQHYQLLLELKALETQRVAPTIGVLAERMRVRHHSAVGLVDRMVSRNLVGRRQLAADQRRVFVVLKPQGRAILRSLAKQSLAELRTEGPALVRVLTRLSRRQRARQ